MMLGYVRNRVPRIMLILPTPDGETSVEFIVDTAFDGDLALPTSLANRLDSVYLDERYFALADGSVQHRPCYEVTFVWNDESTSAEIAVLEGNPLLGVGLLEGSFCKPR